MINSPTHMSGDIWLSPQPFGKRSDGSLIVNVCMKLEDGVLAAIEMLRLTPDGVFHKNDKAIGSIDSPELSQYIEGFQLTSKAAPAKNNSTIQNIAGLRELCEKVPQVYADTKSIKKTASLLGISEGKARRILFTTKHYTCETHEKVMGLLGEGKPLDEIASSLGKSRKIVQEYLPYDLLDDKPTS